MRQVQMKLAPLWQRDLGHCQVTYYSKNDKGQRLVYCLQDNGARFGGVRLLRCSQDHEPCHQVTFTEVKAIFERPPIECETTRLVNEWIDKYEAAI